MKPNPKSSGFFSLIMLLVTVLLTIILSFQKYAGNITNDSFYNTYLALGVVSSLCLLVSFSVSVLNNVKTLASEKAAATTLGLDNYRGLLSTWPSRLLIAFALCFLIVGAYAAAGSVITVPNPYGAGDLTAEALSQHGTITNVANMAFYPGFFEEIPVFFLVNIVMFLGTLITSFVLTRSFKLLNHPLNVFAWGVIGVTTGAFFFMFGHNTSYGLNAQAKLSAFIFEWVVQAANQVGGFFISWLPHLLHNGLVVFNTFESLSISGGLFVVGIGWELFARRSTT